MFIEVKRSGEPILVNLYEIDHISRSSTGEAVFHGKVLYTVDNSYDDILDMLNDYDLVVIETELE